MKIKNILLLVLILRGVSTIVAQPLNASRPEYVLQVADTKFEAKDYFTALEWYTKYYDETKEKNPVPQEIPNYSNRTRVSAGELNCLFSCAKRFRQLY